MRSPVAAVLATSLALASPASATRLAPEEAAAEQAAATRVTVEPLTLEGAAEIEVRERLQASLAAGLARAGFLTERGDAEALVVRATVRVVERDYELAIKLIDARGRVVVDAAETCTICGVEEAAALLEAQGPRLATKLELVREQERLQAERDDRLARQREALARQPILVVRTEPAGALVTIDGEDVGPSPLEHPVSAGVHLVRVRLDGHVSEEREVTAERGVKQRLYLHLQTSPTALPPTRLSNGLLISGGASAALGLAGLGLMTAGLVIGRDVERDGEAQVAALEAEGRSGLEITDALAELRAKGQRANTMAIAGGVSGALLLIVGATLIGVSTTRAVRRVGVSPSAGPGRAGLVITGRF